MKTVLITGTSHGIGKETALTLLAQGYIVTGISRTKSDITNDNFTELLIDLCDTKNLSNKIKELVKNNSYDILINNAGVGYYGPHETLSPEKIHEMVTVNLEVPLIISSIMLPQLKANKGMIIDISSITAKKSCNTHGVAYGATKAGLTSFGTSLFEEVRKSGLRIVTIHPDMTSTNLYRNADFEASDEAGCYLSPSDVADAVLYAVNSNASMNISDITLSPQYHRISRKKPM